MQAILTKYLGPTNTKGGRVTARWAETGRKVTEPWDYELDVRENHEAAARALVAKADLGNPRLYAGSTKTGYAFVVVFSD
jgi:hypothetical protein